MSLLHRLGILTL